MSYQASKHRNKWRILFRSYENGKPKWKQIPREAWPEMGIDSNWTLEQARVRTKQLNAQDALIKQTLKSKVSTIERVKKQQHQVSTFIPQAKLIEFEDYLSSRYGRKPLAMKSQMTRWATAAVIINELQLKMELAYFRRNEVWGWFIKRQNSLDYTTKVVRVLNKWGEFLNPHYIHVPTPDSIVRGEIHEAYQNSLNYRGSSRPLSPALLESIKPQLKEGQYNWLFVSVWFGLRPEEIDSKKTRLHKEGGTTVLSIYQSKLVTLKPDDRWKLIPVLYPEQRTALKLWENCQRPLTKTIQKLLGENFYLYAGRKGFHTLMRDKHSDEVICTWLGHQSMDTLRTHYIERSKVRI